MFNLVKPSYSSKTAIDYTNVVFGNKETTTYNHNYFYYLVNTEFKYNQKLIGFELHAVTSGSMTFEIGSINLCGAAIFCSDYFESGATFGVHTYTAKYSAKYTINAGYNKIMFPKALDVQKGWFVYISNLNAYLALDTKKYEDLCAYYNDWVYVKDKKAPTYGTSGTTYQSIGYGILLNTISEQPYYQGYTFIQCKYDHTGTYNISVKFVYNNLRSKSTKVISIKSNFFNLILKDLVYFL